MIIIKLCNYSSKKMLFRNGILKNKKIRMAERKTKWTKERMYKKEKEEDTCV